MNAYEQQLLQTKKERDAILALARILAAKHVRSGRVCQCCGDVAYMNTIGHNPNCEVKKLETYT